MEDLVDGPAQTGQRESETQGTASWWINAAKGGAMATTANQLTHFFWLWLPRLDIIKLIQTQYLIQVHG